MDDYSEVAQTATRDALSLFDQLYRELLDGEEIVVSTGEPQRDARIAALLEKIRNFV